MTRASAVTHHGRLRRPTAAGCRLLGEPARRAASVRLWFRVPSTAPASDATWPVPVEVPPCALCGGESFTTVIPEAVDRVWRRPGRFAIERCDACGLAMTRPRPTSEGLAFYYEGAYSGGSDGIRRFQFGPVARLMNRYRLAVIARIHKLGPHDRLLDVGCSYGALLSLARQSGCATAGLDVDAGSIAGAADRDHTDYRTGRLIDADWPDGYFTVITLIETLEHESDPLGTLRAAHRLLAPNGVLVVEVPDFSGAWRYVFGRYWLPLLVPQHLVHYTRHTLHRALELAGFEPVLRRSMCFPFEGVASLGLWLGHVLRTPPPGSGWSWRTPFDWMVGMVLVVLYFVFEIPSQVFLSLARRSGHQLVVARRRSESEAHR